MRKKKKANKINKGMALRFVLLCAALGAGIFWLLTAGPSPQPRTILHDQAKTLSSVRLAMPPLPPQRVPAPAYEEPLTSKPQPEEGGGSLSVPPVAPPAGKGPVRVALVIDDMGGSAEGSARAIRLPGAVTLSFLPYAPEAQTLVNKARQAGHEILLHLPMQPISALSPGPDALRTAMSDAEITQELDKNLGRFTGYDGVNNHMGSQFTADAHAMEVVIAGLKAKGLFFLDSRTSPHSVGAAVAKAAGVPTAERDVFLDDDPAAAAVRKQLARVLEVAHRKGHAIVIGHPHPETLAEIEGWIATLPPGTVQLVPLHDLIP